MNETWKNNKKIDKISIKYLLTDISFRILYWYLQMLDIMLIYGWYTQDFNPYHQKHRWVHWRENHRKWFFPLKRKPTVSRFLKGNLIKYSDQWRTHIESKAHFVSGPLRFSFCLRVTSAALHIKKKMPNACDPRTSTPFLGEIRFCDSLHLHADALPFLERENVYPSRELSTNWENVYPVGNYQLIIVKKSPILISI